VAQPFIPFALEKRRYKVAYGGRGGGKSQNFARLLLMEAMSRRCRILNARAVQRSLKESIYQLYSDLIHHYRLEHLFHLRSDCIEAKNGSKLLFMGLNGSQSHSLRSLEQIDICFIEEAEEVEEQAWQNLQPTIRGQDSEIWVSFNPKSSDSAVYKRFIEHEREDCLIKQINYDKNPFLPAVLYNEMLYDKTHHYERYRHIWLGELSSHSEELIFHGCFEEAELGEPPPEAHLYHGLDFGFAHDPTVLISCSIEKHKLYIWRELYLYSHAVEAVAERLRPAVPPDQIIYADDSRPELISCYRRQDFAMRAAKKGPHSIIEGLSYLQRFERIIIDGSCTHLLNEMRRYRYKRDRNTGDLLAQPEDRHNHGIDALRYALSSLIHHKISLLDVID
jgi:phage terminase large subunit